MIDTIVLTLSSDMYRITHPEKFSPSASSLRQGYGGQASWKCFQNPSYKERARGIYKPRLTLSAHGTKGGKQEIFLRIELSLPKLFFGNNLQELQYKDFRPCAHKLITILRHMGIETSYAALAKAPVSAIHYSKNIALTGGYTPHYFINKIKQANVKLSLDTNQIQYKNDGHSYRWHCKSYEVIFYDKMRDLQKGPSKKKRPQPSPFRKKRKYEIFRMEVRLNKRQKIKQLFNSLNIKSDYTFKKMFKPAISKKILLHYIDELERMRPAWLDHKADSDKQLLASLIINNPSMGGKKITQMFGLKKMLETMTMREIRTMLGNKKSSWHKLMADARDIKLSIHKQELKFIRDSIIKFKHIGLT